MHSTAHRISFEVCLGMQWITWTVRLSATGGHCLANPPRRLLRSQLSEAHRGSRRERYISYAQLRLGEDQPHKTTTQNISDYLYGIDSSLLPQTIKDAINTTHALGIRYSWIDTLCIIQDSSDDKTCEISLVDKIYTKACLTIIASSPSRISDGFLHGSRVPSDTVTQVRYSRNGQIGTVYITPCDALLGTPTIDTRAWCYQELLLSPHALVFSSHALQYYCHSNDLGEPHNLSSKFDSSIPGRLPPILHGIPNAPPLDLGSLMSYWHRIV
jgi:hypothetical protein